MELLKVKYFQVECPKCHKIYEIKLKLLNHQIHCYKCAIKLDIPEIDLPQVESVNTLIDEANKALETLSREYKIRPDGDGLVINPLPLIPEPSFAQA